MTDMNRPQADSTLALVKEEPTSEDSGPPFAPLCLNLPDANIIIRSSDQVNFQVHKSLLVLSSPFFKSILSTQSQAVDLPVVQLTEDAELVNSLVSLLYPIAPIIPSSYEKVFALLAACQKYNMASIQSSIRAEVIRGSFPAPIGTEAFFAYAIASDLGLIPEMESAARLTLGYPMTFESLTKWAQGVGQTGTPAKRKKLGCQGLQREFKYMNASLYLHVKRMYSTLVTFCRNPVSYLVQNAKIICTTLMQGNVPDQ